MNRIAMGAVTALAVWFGSALAAEAQTITPNGPMNIQAGTNTWTFTGTVYLPTPNTFKIATYIYKNNVYQLCIITSFPNPGVQNSPFSQNCCVPFTVATGDVVSFRAQLIWNKTTTYAPNWDVTVTATRPTSKSFEKSSPLAIQGMKVARRQD